jgi:hypothetical protein
VPGEREVVDAGRGDVDAPVRDELAAHAPGPVARRLRAAAGRDRASADTHDATARPAGAPA